ncbi:DUF1534 domain-containing protein, partial [Pseudomonas syringae pv. actinidiae]|nr:DUF1534 domain-containing protein [Pseudomonas syringae pv. actinidiae]
MAWGTNWSCDRHSAEHTSLSMPFQALNIGRGASRTACDAERRTIIAMIVPHA